MAETAKYGIAVMREYHSTDGLDQSTQQMLESLGDAATVTLRKDWTEADMKNFMMVLLRSACQIGRQCVAV